MAQDFATEAFEEGAAEYLTPKYKRMTYDPNAQDATGEEIAYAAFVGGLTGAVMNGANGAVTLTSDAVSGKKAKASGQVELIEKLGKQISEEEAKSPSGYELLANIKKIYDRGGDSAVRVGQLKRMEAAARLLPAVEKSAMAIVSAPQYAVERFARMGVTEINGKPLSAEMLTEAIDLDHGNKAALKTLRQAISKNPILATLAMADATAKLQLDSTKYTEGIAREGALGTSGDWNTFLATASAEEKAAVGKMFGVENIDALDYGTARAYAQAYAESDEGKATVRRAVRAKDAVEAIAENDKPLPKVIVTTDGARRYGEVGIIKEGGEVRFYDYTTGRMTQPMTVREANAKLAQDRAAALSETATENKAETKTETKTEAKKPTADEEIHTWAMENIKKYNELTGRERQEVRATIRQARALGISEADTITYATVAARSGVRIVFSKARCLRRVIVDEGGKPVTKVGFSDGFYNHDTNEIVVNPEGKRSPTKLLLHELAHALYTNKGFAKLLDRAAKKMDDDRKKEITNRYTEAGQEEFIPEEHAVHHAEDVIGNDATLERLLRDEPTMGDKILSFFGLAKTDYQGHERLSRAAGRLYNRYKATFDRFATANRGTVRIEGIGDSKGIRDAESEHYTIYDEPITSADIATLRSFGRRSINELASDPKFLPATQKWAHKFYSELGTKSPFFRAWFGDWRAHQIDGVAEFFIDAPVISSRAEGDAYVRDGIKNKSLYRGDVVNADTKFTINIGAQVYNDSLTYANREYSRGKNQSLYTARISILSMLENIVRDSVLFDTRIVDADGNVQDRSFMHYFYSLATVDGKSYLVKLSVDELESRRGTIRRAYNVDNIEISPVAVTQVYKPAGTTGDMEGNTPLTHSISDLHALVKQYDKEFSPKSVSEHVLNDDGTPKVFYHGTRSKFTEFILQDKPSFGRALGDGFYFTPNYKKAHQFANGLFSKGEDRGGIVMPVYLRMENPYVIEENADRTKWRNEYHKGDYDGIIDLKNQTWYVEESTQIKSASTGADANIGTFDQTNPGIRYALPDTDSDGEALTEQQKEYFKYSRTKDSQGRLLVLYHQTNAEFTEFDTQREGAGSRDNETPHGIFLKPTDENIGLKGDKQMRLYANITNPLKFYTRADAQWYWKHNIDGYADILAQIAVNDRVYKEQFEEAFNLKRLARRRRNTELSEMERKEIDALYEESEAESQKVLDEWTDANTALDKKAKALIDEYLKDNGYDGVFLLEDQGSFGRKVQTYIALSAEQVKNTDNKTPTKNPDIRFALPEDATYVSPTAVAVGKTKDEYKADFRDKVFTAKTRTYIDTVDELYGIETYLRKVGKKDKAAVEALVQQARAARSQAQTMIGTAQYNVFSDKVERMGDGLLEILKPTKNWTAKKKGAFDDYLLNQLNIDRMTLESRTTMWAAPVRARLAKQQSDLANLKKLLSRMERKAEDLATEIGNARGHRDTAKLSKTREKWRTRIAELENSKSAAEALVSQYEKDIKAASRAVDKTKAELDAMIVKNKPVFGKDETLDEHGNVKRDHDITADESRDIVKKYEAAYPEFANLAKRLYAYLDNVQKLRVEAGLITQDMADHMKKLYPHYVPSYRDVEGGGIASIKGKNAMEVQKTVRKAQGGNQNILDVAVSIAMQTDEVLKAGQINKLSRALYDAAKSSGDETYVKIVSEEVVGAQEDAVDAVMRPKPGQLTFYADGNRVTLAISKELLYGFDGLRKPSVDFESPVAAALAKMNEWYKRGVTSLNPAFAIRNPIRDIQDAGLNSKHPLLFAKQMAGLAQKGIASNSERWELYRAMGGFSSTVFDGALHKQAGYAGFESISELFSAAKGETDLKAAWRKLSAPAKALFRSVENANAFLEQTTRFAEFCASLDAGDSPAVALNNSAEVTTNFGRRGRITKVLNATVMPFLNPAVQGFDKLFRNVGDAFTGGHWVRGVATLITKAAIIGIAPMLLNSIMYDDDEEYEKLRETDKENNFLIKTSDGTFIKIPRGRLASVIGGLYNRGDKLAKGEDAELAGYASNVVSQITPVENVSRTIFSPLSDVKNNRTWYGGEIEGREWEDTAPRDRYDESTSSIAVWIGQAINYSPKKVHYLLDQYSGVIGDFLLPATSKKEKRDFFSGNFTLDSVTSNKLSERFYDAYDKTAYADTAGDEAATYRLKYLNDVKKAVRDMNKELDEIRNSDLSNTEKLQQTRVVRSLINAAYDSALKSLDAVNAAIEATKGLDTAAIEAGYT